MSDFLTNRLKILILTFLLNHMINSGSHYQYSAHRVSKMNGSYCRETMRNEAKYSLLLRPVELLLYAPKVTKMPLLSVCGAFLAQAS